MQTIMECWGVKTQIYLTIQMIIITIDVLVTASAIFFKTDFLLFLKAIYFFVLHNFDLEENFGYSPYYLNTLSVDKH